MARRILSCAAGLLCCATLLIASDIQTKGSSSQLTSAQIVEKNVAARGGLPERGCCESFGDEGQVGCGREIIDLHLPRRG